MKNMNEIKNEKRLTKYVEDIHGSHYALGCENVLSISIHVIMFVTMFLPTAWQSTRISAETL